MIITLTYAQGQRYSFELEGGQVQDKVVPLLDGGRIFAEPSTVIGDEREITVLSPSLLSRVDVTSEDLGLIKIAEIAHGTLLENLNEVHDNEHLKVVIVLLGCPPIHAAFPRQNRLPVEVFGSLKRLYTNPGILLTRTGAATLINPKHILLTKVAPGPEVMPKDALLGTVTA